MMRWKKWWFPPVFALCIYISIRLANDVEGGTKFWERWWVWNAIEISTTIALSYPMVFLMNYFRRRNERRDNGPLTGKRLFREFGEVYLYTTILLNAVLITMCATTDNGLQWADVVYINILPPLFNLFYYAMTRAVGSLRLNYEQRLQIEKITNDQLQTELRFLRAQYHPHFLFNALNTVYFQMEEDTGRARQTVEKLSDLLRYQLYDPHHTVPVERELRYLESFIDLQRQRMNDHLELDVYFDPLLAGQQLYPLLLLPLVENAFKYAGGDYWIRVRASLEKGAGGAEGPAALRFEVGNAVPQGAALKAMARQEGPRPGGIGLENLRRRLELLYPGRHEFRVCPGDTEFHTTLIIPI